jgi:hypothetical protein
LPLAQERNKKSWSSKLSIHLNLPSTDRFGSLGFFFFLTPEAWVGRMGIDVVDNVFLTAGLGIVGSGPTTRGHQ